MQKWCAAAFDLDGTLIDSLEDLAVAGNSALQRFGYPVHPVEAYRKFVGSGLRMLVCRALPPHEAERLGSAELNRIIQAAADHYAENWFVHTRPYGGIVELLRQLQEKKIPLAVVTNKPHEWTHRMLEYFFSDISFCYIQGACSDVPHKPDPFSALQAAETMRMAPYDVAFIGDSDVDMLTAHNAGMGAIGATWGFRGADELESAGANVLLYHPSDLLPHICFPL
mgnify:FL=1